MKGNDTKFLNSARKNEKDEFYTRYQDIANEMQGKDFKEKTIYCNCDDPRYSQFYAFFKENFKELGLKTLIASHHSKNPVAVIFDGEKEEIKLLKSGDFRSLELKPFYDMADYVITNPPFSLMKDFIKLLQNKKFLIICHQSIVTDRHVFKMIKDEKLFFGNGFKSAVGYFTSPYEATNRESSNFKEGFIRVSGVDWITNEPSFFKKNKEIPLLEEYKEENYEKLDNYDCINVPQVKRIPKNYKGYMAVPITYLPKHCHSQFEICGLDDHRVEYPALAKANKINGRNIFRRVIIRKRG